MRVSIIKEERFDRMELKRDDGTSAVSRFPKKGPVPHDCVHYFVEHHLGLKRGFWGMVQSGLHPEYVSEMAKAAGHASAKRADLPDETIIELLQAERIVECFEASLWDGGSDPALLRDVARVGCESSHVALPEMSDEVILAISNAVGALNTEWTAAPLGHVFQFEWH